MTYTHQYFGLIELPYITTKGGKKVFYSTFHEPYNYTRECNRRLRQIAKRIRKALGIVKK